MAINPLQNGVVPRAHPEVQRLRGKIGILDKKIPAAAAVILMPERKLFLQQRRNAVGFSAKGDFDRPPGPIRRGVLTMGQRAGDGRRQHDGQQQAGIFF